MSGTTRFSRRVAALTACNSSQFEFAHGPADADGTRGIMVAGSDRGLAQ
jgi:hypothetical protein